MFGEDFSQIIYTSPNAPYFESRASSNPAGMDRVFVKYTIPADELTAQTDFAGGFSDSFRIIKPGALVALRLFVEDNPLLVSLLVAPIVLGVAVVSLNRWKGWPPLSRR